MAITVTSILTKVQLILQDTTNVRWTEAELLGWLNDSYKEIINARPDAHSESYTFACTQNSTRQVLPSGAIRLLDVTYNLSSGRAIRLLPRIVLDDTRRAWHTETGADIEHWMFDPKLPREFFVYPAPSAPGHQIEIVYSSVPADHTDAAGDYRLIDSYHNATVDYMLYRAYSKDAEYAANAQRAAAHYQAMQTGLGVKTQSDAATAPTD